MSNTQNFISEINNLEKPKSEEILVNDIVTRYLPIGSEEVEIMDFLDKNGFEVSINKKSTRCPNSEKVYLGTYDFKTNYFLPPKYRLVGFFCVSHNRLEDMKVYFLKHRF